MNLNLRFSQFTRGFTVIEAMVAVLVFSLTIGGASNLLLSSITAQRGALAQELLLSQTSFVAEYMSRALRQAKKELNDPPQNCLTTAGRGFNYEMGEGRIRFLNKDNICQEILLSGTQIQELRSTDATAEKFGAAAGLTSSDIIVEGLRFSALGESQSDDLQPRVTFLIQAKSAGLKPEAQKRIELQTAVSQRNFDVIK